jgi:hypothetical protein
MNNRDCPHAFYCWYRIDGQCCHSAIENLEACRGQEPSRIHIPLITPQILANPWMKTNQEINPPKR